MGARRSVALITPRYAPDIGGVERHVEMLARGMVARGMRVEVITTDPTRELPRHEMRDGVVIWRFPTLGRKPVFFISFSLGWWLLRNARRFALMHAHSYHTPMGIQTAFASWITGVPMVFTPHYHGAGHSVRRELLHVPYRPLGHLVMRRARRVLCNSRTERAALREHFGKGLRTALVVPGVNVARYAAGTSRTSSSSERLVLAAGRLEPYKQHHRLVQALIHLPPGHRVVIVGEGSARAGLEDLAQESGVADRLDFVGHVTEGELVEYYRASHAFVTLSRHEAFGLTVLEAAVAGSMVVASDIPAHREVAGYLPAGGVRFVDVDGSAVQVAEAIQDATSREWAVPSEHLSLPTWDRTVGQAVDVYRSVIGTSWLPAP